MPILEIHLLKGRSDEKKRILVSELTKTICDCLEVKAEQVRIIIDEMEYSRYAVGGVLMSEKYPERKI